MVTAIGDVSTDYDTSTALLEPLTFEDVMAIYKHEAEERRHRVIVQFGDRLR